MCLLTEEKEKEGRTRKILILLHQEKYPNMTLITSISGIRGTVGGLPGEGLTPPDIVRFVVAWASMMQTRYKGERIRVVVGRDGRMTGPAINRLVCGILQLCGVDVVDLGLSTTPSTEMAVPWHKAHGGIILTASHNPAEWNAMKLLNDRGEFISAQEGEAILRGAEQTDVLFPAADKVGDYVTDYQSIERHVDHILDEPLVDIEAIRNAGLKVAFDAVNSTGGIALPLLLGELGVAEIIPLNEKPDGNFAHNPEPLPEHLGDLSLLVKKMGADLGFAVDPDVDRLAIVCENGEPFGEEYTLVAVADYVLSCRQGNSVSNLSSTRALRDITEKRGGRYTASAVGEVNVVHVMKEVDAVIGGEGNGGVILPSLHYGRDALAGIALFLTWLAKSRMHCSDLRKTYPDYHIRKHRIQLSQDTDVGAILQRVESAYPSAEIIKTDGLKIDLAGGWIHLRRSNTEPIIRIYTEAQTPEMADSLAREVMALIHNT